jgi:hypothetical protein
MIINKIAVTDKDVKRFYQRITVQENGCWDISYAKDRDGYSRFGLYSKDIGVINVKSHRFMYLLYHQEENIENLEVCHKCDNPGCVNPDHLFLGTHQDNVSDCVNKNRQSKGSNLPHSILNEQKIRNMLDDILIKKFISIRQIADYYTVTSGTIGFILNGKTWKHVTKDYDMNKIRNMIINYLRKRKLSIANVKDIKIKLKNNIPVSVIAKDFNVDVSTIYGIKLNRIHKNI